MKYYHVFATTTCPYCTKAVNLLNETDSEYILSLVDRASDVLKDIKKSLNHPTVPIITEHDTDDESYQKLIGGSFELEELLGEVGGEKKEEELQDPE
tara:strand:- start:500 stop:790 length:291 start_codon:yes stop_codon:yes gene_type:complete